MLDIVVMFVILTCYLIGITEAKSTEKEDYE